MNMGYCDQTPVNQSKCPTCFIVTPVPILTFCRAQEYLEYFLIYKILIFLKKETMVRFNSILFCQDTGFYSSACLKEKNTIELLNFICFYSNTLPLSESKLKYLQSHGLFSYLTVNFIKYMPCLDNWRNILDDPMEILHSKCNPNM